MFEKVEAAEESEASLPGGWEDLKARAKARKRVALKPEPESVRAFVEEPAPRPATKAERKAQKQLEALDADEVMAREEQLMLQERQAAVEASSEELSIRKALRKTAAGMGLASLRLTNAMNFVAMEIEERMSDKLKVKEVPLGQLGAVLRAGAQLQEKTARVMVASVELERLVTAQPLGDAMASQNAREIDAPEAIKKLNRMAGIIQRLSAKSPDIAANLPKDSAEELLDDDEAMDDFREMDEED